MARRKGGVPDWLVYGAVLVAILYAVGLGEEEQPTDAVSEPPSVSEGATIGPATPFDPEVRIEVRGPAQPGLGTAFAINGSGIWLTARHVVEGCRVAGIVTGPGQGAPAGVSIYPRADVALLRTEGGPEPLTSALHEPLRVGERSFHVGFPAGEPGEATSRLIGRETLRVVGRGARAEPVLAWAETGRSEGLEGSLAGLSGAPALDSEGRILGVTIAESPRRGRIYTTAPDSLNAALDEAGVEPPPASADFPVTPGNYGQVADLLRRDLRVAMVVCLQA